MAFYVGVHCIVYLTVCLIYTLATAPPTAATVVYILDSEFDRQNTYI